MSEQKLNQLEQLETILNELSVIPLQLDAGSITTQYLKSQLEKITGMVGSVIDELTKSASSTVELADGHPLPMTASLDQKLNPECWSDYSWKEMMEEYNAVEYAIHCPLTPEFQSMTKGNPTLLTNDWEFQRLFNVDVEEIKAWAKKAYGWDIINVQFEFCHDLTYSGLADEECTNAWGYLYVGPHVPRKRDFPNPSLESRILGHTKDWLPLGMEVAPYGDENGFLEWLLCGMGEWACHTPTPNIEDYKAEIEYIKSWWLRVTRTRMENVSLNDTQPPDGTNDLYQSFFTFEINHDDIRAVYGHLECPKSEIDDILRRAERRQWLDMDCWLGWFGKTIDEPTVKPVTEEPPVADDPVAYILDKIQDLSEEQLDMLLERIHANYRVA